MEKTEAKKYQADKLAELMEIVKIKAVVTTNQEFKPTVDEQGNLVQNYTELEETDAIDSVDLYIDDEYLGYSERANPDEILQTCYELFERAGFDKDTFIEMSENYDFPVSE
ncbi:hypothetical protein ACOMCU_01485 [Lysinibacillus sp. UGB7]|uniref:hypothetical protein n=1 Tax=Lysinibacillus sp. UGB7 TaxID=3411039 RepID=UPI003B81047E